MRISAKRQALLYEAIHIPVIDTRIIIAKAQDADCHNKSADIDNLLFKLEDEIWQGIKKALT